MVPSCNLIRHKCKPIIPKNYIRCYSCHGTGIMIVSPHYKERYILCYACPICYGDGYIDWIKNILKPSFIKEFYKMGRIRSQYEIPFRCPTNKKCKVIRTMVRQFNRFKKENPKNLFLYL